jgi:uncharacterized membrane protein YhaH (DUF805 family)
LTDSAPAVSKKGEIEMEWMFMPLRRYADFSGRSRRMEFWMWQVAKFLASLVIWVLFAALAGGAIMTAGNDPAGIVAAGGAILTLGLVLMLLGLAIIIPDIAVTVRRLHDTDRTGWWILAPMAPYLVFWITVGTAATSGVRPDEIATGAVGIVAIVCLVAVFVLALMLLVFYSLAGPPGPNGFGPDPKGRGADVFS